MRITRSWYDCSYIHDDKAFNEGLVNLAFWTMQSHILNSDYTDFLPRIVFHIEAALCNATKRLCDHAVVPADSIMTFDETVFSFDRLPPSPSYKALAPFLDPELERFRRVVIVALEGTGAEAAVDGHLVEPDARQRDCGSAKLDD